MRQIHFKQKLCFILHRHYATLEMLVEVKKNKIYTRLISRDGMAKRCRRKNKSLVGIKLWD